MKDQEYWVTIAESQIQQSGFNPRAETVKLKSGKVKVWYGFGHSAPDGRDRTIEEDKKIIKDDLAGKGITGARVTTK